jgi:thioredoxin 1/thioredoxin 2
MDNVPASLDEFVRTHNKPILADFWAEWCGPCKMMAPILQELAKEWKDRITVIKIDTERKQSLAQQFNITGIPTLILFMNGAEAHRITGAMPLPQLKQVLSEFV